MTNKLSWRGLWAGAAATLVFGLCACDREPSWTWVRWEEYDAGTPIAATSAGANAGGSGGAHAGSSAPHEPDDSDELDGGTDDRDAGASR